MRLDGTLYSNSLQTDTSVTIVTPNKISEVYSVVYLLHGLYGNNRSWLDYSLLPVYAAEGHTIYVTPDAGHSFYADMARGGKYFTYVSQELPELMKSVFNISAERKDTYIIGCSMGGYGALKCALTYPERYKGCAAFSSCCLDIKEGMSLGSSGFREAFGEAMANDFAAAFGEEMKWSPEIDITELAASAKEKGVIPELYLTCGTFDPFYDAHEKLRAELDGMGIKYEYEQWPAGHDFIYFNEALRRAVTRFEL